ncbi:MAG TPA: FxLYD domain-containing protein [Candidatus Acidoferrales bacterium]|nr:FxLYD domain-containing protein [Candidatus Acidoferrales bacterium]
MEASKTAPIKPSRPWRAIPPMAIVGSLVLVLGLAGFWYLDRSARQPPPAPPPLTEQARAYVHDLKLKLSEVEMNAHESYLKQSVVEITGKIGNAGERTLKTVELNCVFYDAYGQLVLRERVAIVSAKIGSLAPGETKAFRLPFDNIPASWNQAMPQLVIAGITFQ